MTDYYKDAKHGRKWTYALLTEMDSAIEKGINEDIPKEILRTAIYERFGCNYMTINKHIRNIAKRLIRTNEGV